MEKKEYISCCGLVCSDCDIYRMAFDEKAAEGVMRWFKGEGWIKEDTTRMEVIEKGMYCKGCRADRSGPHWSPKCHLLICALDEHSVESCADCPEFVCEKLLAHEKKDASYKDGVDRLRKIKANRKNEGVDRGKERIH